MVCGQRKYFLCDLRNLGVSLLIFSRLFACFAGSISDISPEFGPDYPSTDEIHSYRSQFDR
jgi:hypothetical protein